MITRFIEWVMSLFGFKKKEPEPVWVVDRVETPETAPTVAREDVPATGSVVHTTVDDNGRAITPTDLPETRLPDGRIARPIAPYRNGNGNGKGSRDGG